MKSLISKAATTLLESQLRRALEAKAGLVIERWNLQAKPLSGSVEASDVLIRRRDDAGLQLAIGLMTAKLDLGAALKRNIVINDLVLRDVRCKIRLPWTKPPLAGGRGADRRGSDSPQARSGRSTKEVVEDEQARGPLLIIEHAQLEHGELELEQETGGLRVTAHPVSIRMKRDGRKSQHVFSLECDGVELGNRAQSAWKTGPVSLELKASGADILAAIREAAVDLALRIRPTGGRRVTRPSS